MKRTLSFMVMAFALLLTQCRKPEVKFPTPSSAEGVTVSMTVTAGPGSKTNIDADGRITWSSGDKLYVGDGSKCIGCLTLTSGADNPTGTFSGNVTLTKDTRGEQTFHFYYLGRAERTLENDGTSVEVSFAEQTGLRENLGSCHVGYGSANGTVTNDVVTGINVTLVSKVAIAYFSFKDGTNSYDGALTLSGTGIYNKMTVNFDSEGFSCTGTVGEISLTNTTTSEKYVMLVPTSSTTGSQTLNFGGGASGTTTLANGIEANKFYGRESAIEVPVTPKPKPKFTVDKDGSGNPITVEFSPGNLYWDGSDSKWKFEANQWDFRHYYGKTSDAAVIGGESTTTPAGTVGSFFWSKTASVAYASSYSGSGSSTSDVFFTNTTQTTADPNFTVNGETGTWRTLSQTEWDYILKTRDNASSLHAWKELDEGTHNGLVILPDGTDVSVMSNISSTSDLATHGAVFLPAAGYRHDMFVSNVRLCGYYWSSAPGYFGSEADRMYFSSGNAGTTTDERSNGIAVRLVRQ